jgi:hypothetical protein
VAVVEHHPMFKMWDKANKRWRSRQEFHQALKKKYPTKHPLVRFAKKAVEESAKELADIIKRI